MPNSSIQSSGFNKLMLPLTSPLIAAGMVICLTL
jgi:hypothetical protein